MLSIQNDAHVSLILFYCLKVHIRKEEVKHWQNFVYYFMNVYESLQTFHIRISLMKSSFELMLYKAL